MANIKTAISIQQSLFDQVEEVARQLKIPRSRVFVLAVEEFVRRQENQHLLAQINEAYAEVPDDEEEKRMRQARRSQRRIVEGEW